MSMFADARRLLPAAFTGWWADNAMSLGAAIAFYTVFSLAPMLLAVIAVAGLVFGQEAAQGAMVTQVGGLVGKDGAEAIQTMIASASNFGSGVLGTVVGVVTFLFLATGAIVELQNDLNIVWKVKPSERSGILLFIRTRLLSLGLIVGFGFLLLVSLTVDAGLSAVGHYLSAAFSGAATLLHILNFVVSLAVTVLLFAAIFKILPDVDLGWRDVWIGAVITALLFTLGKFVIGLYLGRSNLTSSFGAAASVITILLWIYYSSLIVLFGAEFTKAYADAHGRPETGSKDPRATRPE